MDEDFFASLVSLDRFDDVPDRAKYHHAPDSWAMVITDVVGSTRAIEEGRYKDVNALGVASIVALRNAAAGVDLPFVFGGDGATILCPKSRLPQIEPALRGLQRRAREAFDLSMRAGIVPIDALRAAGHDVMVARYAASADASFAMFAGAGLVEGEKWVKGVETGAKYAVTEGSGDADFNGFECRWEPIPSRKGEVVSLLVQVTGDRALATSIYRETIAAIERIAEGDGRPVAVETLRMAEKSGRTDVDAKLHSGRRSGWRFMTDKLKATFFAKLGQTLVERGWKLLDFDGSRYPAEVVANTDFRKFDETLRMVLDVTHAQKAAIEAHLAAEHERGRLVYGMHAAPSALMTCVVTNHQGNHVHFVDGSDGGYALAAKQMKSQLRETR